MESLLTMLGNVKTTLAGLLMAAVIYGGGIGWKLPSNTQEWFAFAGSVLAVYFGLASKDATTGSKPLVVALALLVGLSVSGCATIQPGGNTSGSTVFGSLQAVALADVEAALADATAHNDLVAAQCWAFWVGSIKNGLPTGGVDVKGVASALQLARDLRGAGGQPSALATFQARHDLACAALEKQEGRQILKLGAGAVGVPGLGAVGGLLK